MRVKHIISSIARIATAQNAVVSGAQAHAVAVRTGIGARSRVSNGLLCLYAKAGDLNSVKRVFAEIENPDVYSQTTLLSSCAKLGDSEHARFLFEKMPKRDVAVWNAMITGCADNEIEIAMRYFREMHRVGVRHDKYSLAGVLSLCSYRREVHLVVIKTGFMGETSVVNALITMYFNCGVVSAAYMVFEEAKSGAVCDQITFNAMINGFVNAQRGEEALVMFKAMHTAFLRPTKLTFVSVMSSCSELKIASELHGEAVKLGFESCTAVGNSAIAMYSSCGDLNSAWNVFERLEEKDIVSWNSMISSYVQGSDDESVVSAYQKMQKEEIKPDEFTIGGLLASSGSVNTVEMIHCLGTKNGLILRVEVSNALVSAYSKHEIMNFAHRVFRDITEKNLISWNTVISGFASNNFPVKALQEFSNLLTTKTRPNLHTLTTVLSTCANISSLKLGKQIHGFTVTSGFLPETSLSNALISMYAKSGNLDCSVKVFDQMTERDTVSHNALISAHAQHGQGEEALRCFDKLQARAHNAKPDQATFTTLLSACSHAGLVNEGSKVFNDMVNNHGFTPTIDHFSCVVDLLARSGYLDEAEALTKSKCLTARSDVYWGLLSACVAHGNVRLGRVVAGMLLETERDKSPVYVLLANIYAAADRWQEAAEVRELMSRTGTAKQPGCCWIAS